MRISEERLKALFENLKNLRILVVGDIILDEYLLGDTERISPEAPVPVFEVKSKEVRLGGAGNVAKNLVDLGCKVFLTGIVGKDEEGKVLKDLIESAGIHALFVYDDRPTTTKTRIVARSQQLLRIDREDRTPVSGAVLESLLAIVKECDCDGVIVSDYAKGVVVESLTRAVRERKIFWAVDPRPSNKALYKEASLMTPNEKELKAMTQAGNQIEDRARRLKEELNLETLVVTRGPKGMTLVREEISHFPARAKRVYDVTGAGDTVIASLTAFHLAGASWEEACEIANLCAGIVVGELGTASVRPEDILLYYRQL